MSWFNNSLGGLKFGKDGDGNVGYYGADGSLIPFKRYKTATRSKSYSVLGGYLGSCQIDFSDVFQDTILGIISVTKTGEAAVGAGYDWNSAVNINNVNKTITLPVYGGTGGAVRNVSGTISVTAIGY